MTTTTLTPFLVLPYLAMSANVLTMILVSHIVKRLSYAIIGGVISGLSVVVLGLIHPSVHLAAISNADYLTLSCVTCLSYLGYSFCFWTLINLNVTSLRIRITREIYARTDATIPASELRAAYDPRAALLTRIDRMTAGGQLAKNASGNYVIGKPFVLLTARFLYLLRRMILPARPKT